MRADLDRVLGLKLLRGVFLSGDLLAGEPFRFVHGLRRPFNGWVLLDTTGADPVYRVNLTSTDSSSEVWLQSASDTSIKVYVF